MPPKTKKKFQQGLKGAPNLKKGKRTEEEKENNLELSGTKCAKKLSKLQIVEKKVEGNKIFSPPLTPQTDDCNNSQTSEKVKPRGFWSKKLQDLEENETKNKKHRLYEFSAADDYESYRTTKKQRQKARPQKERQPVLPNYNKAIAKRNKLLESEKKTEQIRKALNREQDMLNKERKQLINEGKNFTFSIGMQSLGITSTPAINKDNLVGASNFLFLSPIIKEDEYCNDMECLPLKLKADDENPHLDVGTPNVQAKLKRLSCRRVLRNGKMLVT